MKKITAIAVVGILAGLVFLYFKHRPAEVAVPQIRPAAETSSSKSSMSEVTPVFAVKRAVRPETIVRSIAYGETYGAWSKRHGQLAADTRRKAKLTADRLASRRLAKRVQRMKKTIAVPRHDDQKWVKHLGGNDIVIDAKRFRPRDQDCTAIDCRNHGNAYVLAGVVVEPARFSGNRAHSFGRKLESGDGQRLPFLYVK